MEGWLASHFKKNCSVQYSNFQNYKYRVEVNVFEIASATHPWQHTTSLHQIWGRVPVQTALPRSSLRRDPGRLQEKNIDLSRRCIKSASTSVVCPAPHHKLTKISMVLNAPSSTVMSSKSTCQLLAQPRVANTNTQSSARC